MALKPRHKRRIIWSLVYTIGALCLAMVIIPPMITLNQFKPMVEKSVYEQTAVPAQLNGDIHFSLIGGATIVAHDVVVPTARIGSVMFSIPFSSFFDLANARLDDAVVIYDADITIDKLAPADFNHNIEIYNSNLTFMGRKFYIVRADFTNGEFHGIIRSQHHKYNIEFIGDTFHITNKNNNLDITGQMFSDGSIRGHLSIETDNIDDWLGIKTNLVENNIKLSANFEWNGYDSYKLTNIESDKFSGNIEVYSDNTRSISLVSNDISFDISFLLQPNGLLNNTTVNLDFYGDLTLDNHKFHHLRIQATGTTNKIQIANILADDIAITGGTIDRNGAENIMITLPVNDTNTMCLFSGTTTHWGCSIFTYGDMSGSLSVSKDNFEIFVQSAGPMPTDSDILKMTSRYGKHGTINFQFSDMGGTYKIDEDKITATYNFAKDKTLSWLDIKLPYLPQFMLNDVGDFAWHDGMLTFVPHNNKWQLSVYDNYFYLSGLGFKSWFPDIDLRSINDASYTVSGFYNDNKISNLTITISDHEFIGSVSDNNITLHTDKLVLDKFLNALYFDNFAEMEFLSNSPLLIPFDFSFNLALSANSLIYNGDTYNNFIYALKSNSQTYSIMDTSRGNLLATIERDKTNYDIHIQLNRFETNGPILSSRMPLNIRDSFITGQISLTTHGQIAHDIYYNLSGTLDLTFTGGYLIGMSLDDFYSSAENISTLNAEYALSNAFSGGETQLKSLHLVGDYSQDRFITTRPLEISIRHTTGIGGLAITDGMMTAELDLTMRGTAPTPVTIQLGILPDGTRQYSLSEIMQNLDTGFMRAFVKTHDKF
ncbi:MAG: hypothetical protein IKJ62_00710 [Alphaproteobacteria bacterium]|nr:hypothetical protein [Alphaproteobacteria bacterium]